MSHISFSELSKWNFCPFARKLAYEDRIRNFQGNIFTAFGLAIHAVCEKYFETNKEIDKNFFFGEVLRKELRSLEKKNIFVDGKKIKDFYQQGLDILTELDASFTAYFGPDFKFVKAEDTLMESITEFTENEYKFKGFIDLVVQTPDGKCHIIDYKSCSWGWDMKKRTDPMVTYQLTLYKHYWAQKLGVDSKDIETHFCLLKRTGKPGDRVELFRVTSGPRKTKNALNLMKKALYNINRGNHIKNRISCSRCEFHRTEHCP